MIAQRAALGSLPVETRGAPTGHDNILHPLGFRSHEVRLPPSGRASIVCPSHPGRCPALSCAGPSGSGLIGFVARPFDSIPHVPFVEFDLMSPQEESNFILERPCAMVLLLRGDVF